MLHINKDDVPDASIGSDTHDEIKGGKLVSKIVYGKFADFMYAERPDDYHSSPHHHVCEQFNFVHEGKIWIFIEDEAYLLEPGDFNRIPPEAIHWAKVEEGTCVMTEAHAPPMIGDDWNESAAVGLFADDEDPNPDQIARNIWADDPEKWSDNEDEMMERALEAKQ